MTDKIRQAAEKCAEELYQEGAFYRQAQGSKMKDEKQVQLSPEGQAIMDKFATPLYCGYPGSSKWEDEIPIIQRIADRYKECSIHIFEQPEFAVVEAVLRCADEAGFSLVRKK